MIQMVLSLKGVRDISKTSGNYGLLDFYTEANFQSLVDAIIPPDSSYAAGKDVILTAGALELKVHEYVIWILDHSIANPVKKQLNLIYTSFSRATAQLLNLAAAQFIQSGKAQTLNAEAFPGGGPFAALSRSDRLSTITLLERLEINLESLPVPYQNNPGLIRNMMDALNQLTMFGQYSEWQGYGTTRLLSPDCRHLELFPAGWIQSRYPGPAFGYRDFRGFLAVFPNKRGEAD